MSLIFLLKKESFSQVSPIVYNDKPGYVEKLSLLPLLPKVKKKKKKRRRKRSKKEEEWVTTWPKHIPRIDFYPNGQKFMEVGELDCIHYYLEYKSVGVRPDMRYCSRSRCFHPDPGTKHISVPPRHMTKPYAPDFQRDITTLQIQGYSISYNRHTIA